MCQQGIRGSDGPSGVQTCIAKTSEKCNANCPMFTYCQVPFEIKAWPSGHQGAPRGVSPEEFYTNKERWGAQG